MSTEKNINEAANPACFLGAVSNSADTDHSKWLERFNKTKEGKIFNLRHDIESFISEHKHFEINTHLAATAWIMAKNTRYENDVRIILEKICPEFFNDH